MIAACEITGNRDKINIPKAGSYQKLNRYQWIARAALCWRTTLSSAKTTLVANHPLVGVRQLPPNHLVLGHFMHRARTVAHPQFFLTRLRHWLHGNTYYPFLLAQPIDCSN